MILVDTSVWIDFLQNKSTVYAKKLNELIKNNNEEIILAPIILMEILQGIKDDKAFEEIKSYLLEFSIIDTKGINSYLNAVNIYRLCRKKGLTVRKSIDLLIASIAQENDLEIFHKDRDFDNIAKVIKIKIYK
jgi:predicted nucleic acid-binding protein